MLKFSYFQSLVENHEEFENISAVQSSVITLCLCVIHTISRHIFHYRNGRRIQIIQTMAR